MKNQFHPKYQQKYFCPEIFGLPVAFLIYDITNQEAQKASRKLQKISGQNSKKKIVGILDETDFS